MKKVFILCAAVLANAFASDSRGGGNEANVGGKSAATESVCDASYVELLKQEVKECGASAKKWMYIATIAGGLGLIVFFLPIPGSSLIGCILVGAGVGGFMTYKFVKRQVEKDMVHAQLFCALYSGDAKEIDRLMPLCDGFRTSEGRTPMMCAACLGNAASVQALLKYNAGLQDKDGKTALMYAAQKGDVDVVKILAPHELKIRDKEGRAAIAYTEDSAVKAVLMRAESTA